jgi:hypothetical protein
MLCISCKNKASADRCQTLAIKGLQFCGRHVKVRTPRIWTEVNNIVPKVILIQKIWRGFSIKNRILQCGPGVLARTLCHNHEELVTMESKDRQYPLDYFGFEEDGRVFWFDIHTISTIMFDKLTPANPYTRQPITLETRRRLRRLLVYKKTYKVLDYSKTWIQICQILEENGFEKTNSTLFESLNQTQFLIFLQLLKTDLTALVAETPTHRGRIIALAAVKHIIKKYTPFRNSRDACIKVGMLLYNLLNMVNPYPTCFAIMSSFTRL